MTDPTDAEKEKLRLAEAELDRIAAIERDLEERKKGRPNYLWAGGIIAIWFLLLGLSEGLFGPSGTLPGIVVVCAITYLFSVWAEWSTEIRTSYNADVKINKIEKRIGDLGFAIKREPARLVLMAKTPKQAGGKPKTEPPKTEPPNTEPPKSGSREEWLMMQIGRVDALLNSPKLPESMRPELMRVRHNLVSLSKPPKESNFSSQRGTSRSED